MSKKERKDLRIVFMGTPDFAVPSLKILFDAGYDICGVITSPDKPAGRGQKLSKSAVKQFAEEHDLRILQPTNLKSDAFLDELRSLKADLQVVVAFRMLPVAVWDMPPMGTINLHASLLPDYRGAAPINWAIINGEKKSGATTFLLQHEIDTGDILFQTEVDISPEMNAGELHDLLMIQGAELVLKTIDALRMGEARGVPQEVKANSPKAPKIFREDCKIDWNDSLDTTFNKIRGLSPYPAAWTELEGKVLKIYQAKKISEDHDLNPGTIQSDEKSYIRIACRKGFIDVQTLQIAGKKRMQVDEFLRGWNGGLDDLRIED